jgi:hypothetical protein
MVGDLTARRFVHTIAYGELEAPDPRQEGRVLSRIGSLLQSWILNAKRVFHILVGLAFMVLTLAVASQTFIEWRDYRKSPSGGLLYCEMYGGLAILLAILCLYTFVKARNVR